VANSEEHQERQPVESPLDSLDGHTIQELSDYLDRGRTPRDPAIEASAGAQNALAALSRLRSLAPKILEAEAQAQKPRDDGWIQRILDQIGVQAHAGRDIPISHTEPSARLAISEGAVRAVIREAGDGIEGLIVERIRLDGDVEVADAPVSIVVAVSTYTGADVDQAMQQFEQDAKAAVQRHTQLNISGIEVTLRNTDVEEDEDS
jgi:hypothetical protein